MVQINDGKKVKKGKINSLNEYNYTNPLKPRLLVTGELLLFEAAAVVLSHSSENK